ncbi:nicotinate-nucleotide--dimethylbenzimidazole phosphoribosyltransferase [Streptomyces sp. XD-27]|uniref:nicotinate-nucleotide--dimethylbenzimidazole phosphoribosyltransferase n=1 Tax=Streptomyces sp. XD-27 TaxID=3062779 RepID=UPI0026F40D4E|nr:nicotinate-nucleotide--dimethylbenzimidazole phosphoribosyltransferase [Streptomyces sp. XD-27]WKX73404.1 nicotinate-nucleotide--dimethylbenzimidazole phosphoribosyltransferase [Streptomyces sp. XD-27]
MTDTGQVPGEGLPENAGGQPGLPPHSADVHTPADAAHLQHPGAPAPTAYAYPDPQVAHQHDGAVGADEDDQLLMPGAQGAWVEHQAQYQVPQQASPSNRRPLHMGPPVPDAPTGGVVRSLADRGPATVPPAPAAAPAVAPQSAPLPQQAAPMPAGGPEYLDTQAAEPAAPDAQMNAQTDAQMNVQMNAQTAEPLPGPQLGELPPMAAEPWPGDPQQGLAAPEDTAGQTAQHAAEPVYVDSLPPPAEAPGAEVPVTGVPVAEAPGAGAPAGEVSAGQAQVPAASGGDAAAPEAAVNENEAPVAAVSEAPVAEAVPTPEPAVSEVAADQTAAAAQPVADVPVAGPDAELAAGVPAAAPAAAPDAVAQHPADGSVPPEQTGAVVAEQPAVAEQPGVVSEQPGVVSEQTGAVAEQPGLVAEQHAVAAEQQGAATEQAAVAAPSGGASEQTAGVEQPGVAPEQTAIAAQPGAVPAPPGPSVASGAPVEGAQWAAAGEAQPEPLPQAVPVAQAVPGQPTPGGAQEAQQSAPTAQSAAPAPGGEPQGAVPFVPAQAAGEPAPASASAPAPVPEQPVPVPAQTAEADMAEAEASAAQPGAAPSDTEPESAAEEGQEAVAVPPTEQAPTAAAAEPVETAGAAPVPEPATVTGDAPAPQAEAAPATGAAASAGPAPQPEQAAASINNEAPAPAPEENVAEGAETVRAADAPAAQAPEAPAADAPAVEGTTEADAAAAAQLAPETSAPDAPSAEAEAGADAAPAEAASAADAPAAADASTEIPTDVPSEVPAEAITGPAAEAAADGTEPAAQTPAAQPAEEPVAAAGAPGEATEAGAAEAEAQAEAGAADPAAAAVPEEPPAPVAPAAEGYGEAERAAVHRVMRERRDIRNGFRTDPIPHEVLLRVLEAAHTAPSVGHSQPWDFVVIRSEETRRTMHELATRQREAYAKSLPKARAKQFKELKIEAILDTPVNIVVTADPTRGGRHTLGRHTQPQMAPYSSALAVENLWLAARAEGLGVGWVSFFDEREMVRALGLPEHLEVVAYLCVGYVDEFPDEPELMQAGWSKRRPLSWVVHEETYGRRALPGEEPHDLLQETLRGIRPLDAKALGEAWERQKRMTKPSGALGMLEIISAQLSGLSRKCPPPIPEPAAVAIFAGDHGVHAQGVTAWPQEVTSQMVANFLGGGAVCNAFANQVGAEVCVVDVGVAGDLPSTPGLLPRKVRAGTDDFTAGPAMSREDALRAIEVGIETARDLVAAGNKALLTGEMGIANTTVSAALISVYTGADPAEITGRGTGINDEMHARKVDVVRRALELHQPDPTDPIGVLAAIGGLEHAALVGLLLGGASLRTPVILDGVSAGAAALVARAIAPEALAACIAGHRSAEPGHRAALTKLGLRPLVDLDLRLGEGTGALLALPVVQSAARAMHEVATFDSAGVTEKG